MSSSRDWAPRSSWTRWKKPERIADPPPAIGLDPDVFLVLGRDLVRVALPFEPALLEVVRLLDEGRFEVDSGRFVTAPPIGSPNWVMMTWFVSETTYRASARTIRATKARPMMMQVSSWTAHFFTSSFEVEERQEVPLLVRPR